MAFMDEKGNLYRYYCEPLIQKLIYEIDNVFDKGCAEILYVALERKTNIISIALDYSPDEPTELFKNYGYKQAVYIDCLTAATVLEILLTQNGIAVR